MHESSEEREFRIGDLPEEFVESVRPTVHWYCLSLVHGDGLIGSGTLVKCGDYYGILTASHVVHNARSPFDFSVGSSDRLGLVVEEKDHSFWIPVYALVLHDLGVGDAEGEGPDMAFLQLPRGEELSTLRAKKSFFDIDLKPDECLETCMDNYNGVWAVAGAVDEQTVEEIIDSQTKRLEFHNTVWFTGPHDRSTSRGFDYIELGVKHDDKGVVPTSFGGLSGGGLWKIQTRGETVRGTQKIIAGSPVLAGVAFYHFFPKGGKGSSGFGRIKCHGPRSVYKNLRSVLLG